MNEKIKKIYLRKRKILDKIKVSYLFCFFLGAGIAFCIFGLKREHDSSLDEVPLISVDPVPLKSYPRHLSRIENQDRKVYKTIDKTGRKSSTLSSERLLPAEEVPHFKGNGENISKSFQRNTMLRRSEKRMPHP